MHQEKANISYSSHTFCLCCFLEDKENRHEHAGQTCSLRQSNNDNNTYLYSPELSQYTTLTGLASSAWDFAGMLEESTRWQ